MLYKFKSKVTGDLIMLEIHGRLILQIIGKDATGAGVILAEDIPAAITALEEAVAQDEAALQANKDKTDTAAERSEADPVHLRQRVQPFLQLLKECLAANASIVWGV